MGPGVDVASGPAPQLATPEDPAPLDGLTAMAAPSYLDDPTANIGGGAPGEAVTALGHWAEGPVPAVALMHDPENIPSAGPAPTPSPAPATPAPAAPVPAQSPPGKGSHGSQTATMEDIKKKDPKLDIGWIDDKDLNAHVRESIDTDFGDAKANKKVKDKIKRDAGIKKLDKENKAALEKARDEAAQRLGIKKGRRGYSKKDLAEIEKDEKFVEEKAAQQKARAEAEAKIRAEHDAAVSAGKRDESVADPADKTIKRETGKNLSRTNFMSWAMYLMGDAEKVKKHFKSIQGVKRDPDMLLAEKARLRYEAARAQFEQENPGYTLPTSGSTHSMRKLHETRNGLGMLGHSLGLAADFSAFENPNLRGVEGEHPGLNAYMIKKFGGGRAQMSIDEDAIERLGKHTAAGKTDAKDEALVQQTAKQFGELADSSDKFQKALTPTQMADLRDGRNAYFDAKEKKAEIERLERRIRKAKGADKQQLRANQEDFKKELQALDAEVEAGLKSGFGKWTGTLDAEIGVDGLRQWAAQATADTIGKELRGFHKLTDAQEDVLAKRYGLSARSSFDPKNKKKNKHKTYEQQLRAELAARKKQELAEADWARKSNLARAALAKKLRDPAKVFGQGEKQADGTWKTKQKYTEVAVMQLLEHGFVRDDAMPARAANAKNKKQVFNAEAVAMLARYGFAPGSNFGDTMHFDFIEGYSDAVAGGRHGANMKRTRFSPEGDYIPPPKPEKKRQKKVKTK